MPSNFRVTTTNHKDIAGLLRKNCLAKYRRNNKVNRTNGNTNDDDDKDNDGNGAATPSPVCAASPYSEPWMEYQVEQMQKHENELFNARIDRIDAEVEALVPFDNFARILLMLIGECCREDLRTFALLVEEQRQRFPELTTPATVAAMQQVGPHAIKGFWYRYRDVIRSNIALCETIENVNDVVNYLSRSLIWSHNSITNKLRRLAAEAVEEHQHERQGEGVDAPVTVSHIIHLRMTYFHVHIESQSQRRRTLQKTLQSIPRGELFVPAPETATSATDP